MKKYILLIFMILGLLSCGTSNENEAQTNGLMLHDGINYEINIPSNWNEITKDSNILPNPKNGIIELAISSDELKYGFSNNLLILSQKLDKPISSIDFSILNNVGSTKEYLEYEKIESKNIDFLDGDKSNIYIFEAKYNISTPKFKYIQTGKICNSSKGYLLTVALSTDIKDTSKYQEILKTFKCK